jgi:hypothetical protein
MRPLLKRRNPLPRLKRRQKRLKVMADAAKVSSRGNAASPGKLVRRVKVGRDLKVPLRVAKAIAVADLAVPVEKEVRAEIEDAAPAAVMGNGVEIAENVVENAAKGVLAEAPVGGLSISPWTSSSKSLSPTVCISTIKPTP